MIGKLLSSVTLSLLNNRPKKNILKELELGKMTDKNIKKNFDYYLTSSIVK